MNSDCVCNRKSCTICDECIECNLMCDCVPCICTDSMICPKCYLLEKQHKESLMHDINTDGPFNIDSPSDIVDYFSHGFDSYTHFTFVVLKNEKRVLIISDDVRFRKYVVEVPVDEFQSLMKRFLF